MFKFLHVAAVFWSVLGVFKYLYLGYLVQEKKFIKKNKIRVIEHVIELIHWVNILRTIPIKKKYLGQYLCL